MAENPLFYRKVVPLNRETHRELHLDTSMTRFGFAAHTHVIPVVLDEVPVGSRYLPIVFVPGVVQPSAVFLMGLRPGENRFVADGRWVGDYIPAYVRRYPFIIGDVQDSNQVVCIDEDFEGLHQAGGEALFSPEGEHTEALQNNIKFINDYFAAAKRTEAFVQQMQKLELFRMITIDLSVAGQETRTLHGIMTVDAEKLATLPDSDFIALRNSGYLPLIYAQIASLGNVDRLQPRAAESVAPTPPTEPEEVGRKSKLKSH